MSTPNDLQALLASIRPRPSPSNGPVHDNAYQRHQQSSYHPGLFPPHPQQQQQPYDGQSFPHPQQHGYHHPSVSSALQSPSPANTPPHHGSDILSPKAPTPRADWQQQQPAQSQSNNPDRAADLLSLLRFSQGQGGIPAQPIPAAAPEQPRSPLSQETTSSHGRNISASDLVASLFGKQGQIAPAAVPAAVPAPQQDGPSENTQDMLLRLLNRPQPGAEVEAPGLVPINQSVPPSNFPGGRDTKGVDNVVLKTAEPVPEGPAKPETVASPGIKESLFTYVNPFDQLAAVSPRTKSPQQADEQATVADVTKEEVHVTASVEEPDVPEMPEFRVRNESPVLEDDQLEAVNDVVGRLVGEIGRSLSGSEANPVPLPTAEPAASVAKEEETEAMLSSIASHLRETASEAKEAGLKETIESAQETEAETATPPVARPTGKETAEALVDSWESAEDSAEKEEERIVSVQNFPLKPFISITVNPQSEKLVTFRDDGIMDIARLKKEFDQLDRSLTAATPEYIVYALAKTGGIRIIRQDDGTDRQVFRSTRDRVFNVALCSSPSASSDMQAILGIGVSGAVYWALISRSDRDLFDLDALESESLVFPPFPASDENTSGGQLKTRAKRSSRHPELFAIGRGKNIYVVSPHAAMNLNYGITASQRTVNTEKFFKERSLKISTGKAGKDFAFSDDDTVIASLDKTGRLRFWDIRDVLNIASFIESPPSEVRVPLNTFVTGSPTEKSWPTSVLFLDKLRAYSRTMALRYVLVGLKQNHTLQLWDIGLGKAVEELKFPHENESDAICSVAYHPSSGIVVVGHPTRNSIYFVHLSAPRYNLPPMSQAEYIKAVSEKDTSLPKPESTACLSGIREISLGSKGQLRSLELLPITKSATDKRGTEETGLFELYVMHSRGVTCLNIKKEDLGWTSDNKVARPVDALEQGSIEITDLQSFSNYVTDEPSVNGDTASTTPSRTVKETVKKTETADATGVIPSRNPSPTKVAKKKEEQVEVVSASNVPDKAEKKKKKKASSDVTVKAKEPSVTAGVESVPIKDQPKENELLSSSLPTTSANLTTERVTPGRVSDLPASSNIMASDFKAFQDSVGAELNKKLGQSFQSLFTRLDDERRSWEAASSAKQDQVLRLVSSTLSDNVEKNLGRIISQGIHNEVIPTITDATSTAVAKQVDSSVSQQMSSVISDELRQALPKSIASTLQQPTMMKTISDAVAQKLAPRIESEVSKAVQSSIAPLVEKLARQRDPEETMERRFAAQMKHLQAQREMDHAKMDEMATMLRDLSSAVASLNANQSRPNEAVAGNQRSLGRSAEPPVRAHQQPVSQAQAGPVNSVNSVAPVQLPSPISPEQAELAEITKLITSGQFEEGTIKWLQSSQQADLFDNFFVRMNPAYLTRLSAIVMLSVGVAVTSMLQTNVGQRLAWLEVVLQNVNPRDPDLREVAPSIMSVLSQRLNSLYMTVVERDPHDPILRLIAPLARRARDLVLSQ
ncbi:hypothetical protein N7492_004369 [Penicillium capsulatum]|uniref:EDC4-like protein pdc1 beta-propeller domain-containing protein n=1 Tax=Penicillium capsulatum TaxID=69766 RepID=A0A9W9LQN8_9EURO|nr:hypothetical protein N7492_004369 [Penicillium capsulatum]KAJ6136512.1 hypothetical protein N7512_001672 [Penicillium capsulatum]